MEFLSDLHTHSIASGHSYNTIQQMAEAANERGLEILGIAEHAPRMLGSCHELYFHNFKVLERKMSGVETLFGVELNVLDSYGHVDLPTRILKKVDYAIASLHVICLRRGTKEENTRALLGAMKNPYVDIIGHPDDARYPMDYKELVYGAKTCGKLLEINNSSILPTSVRQGSRKMYEEMLGYCMEYEVPVIVNTDAHVAEHIGNFDAAKELLDELDFPDYLVVNHSVDEVKKYLHKFL